jgi:hypothetical protein
MVSVRLVGSDSDASGSRAMRIRVDASVASPIVAASAAAWRSRIEICAGIRQAAQRPRLPRAERDGPWPHVVVFRAAGMEASIVRADVAFTAHLSNRRCPSGGSATSLEAVKRVQEVLAVLKPPPTDDEIVTKCPNCKTTQTLEDCSRRERNDETFYECTNECQVLVVVSKPGLVPWPGRGYRVGEWVIRNVADLVLSVKGSAGKVLIPASPAALDERPPKRQQN